MDLQVNRPDTILIVEDDTALSALFQRLLKRAGYTTEAFFSGEELLSRRLPFDDRCLLLLDYTLPDLNGQEVVEKLREKGRRIPFAVITGHGDEQLAVEMMKLGACDYITKGGNLSELLAAKIEHICSQIENERKLKTAEASVLASAMEWQRTFDSIADAVLIINTEHNIIRSNKAASDLVGLPQDSVTGKNCCLTFHGENGPVTGCPMDRMIRSRKRETSEIALKDRFYLITIDPIFDAGNALQGSVHVLIDITEQKKAEKEKAALEEQLRQSQKMEAIGQLASGVAHDFNNLLAGILGNAELLKMRLLAEPDLVRYIDKIINTVTKTAGLTSQLLTFARKAHVNVAPFDIHASIGLVIDLLTHSIDKKIKITTKLSAMPSKINGDAGFIENALLNISINARDSMPNGGTLLFETENVLFTFDTMPDNASDLEPGNYICISIADSGIGMDNETIARIFEPFFTTKEVGKGTGLGLAAVYGCVRQHNGHIAVDSEKGKGSSFRLYLPAITNELNNQDKPAA
jgi:PAS domain S-box-containing protein